MGLFDEKTKADEAKAEKKETKVVEKKAKAEPKPAPASAPAEDYTQQELDELKVLGYI